MKTVIASLYLSVASLLVAAQTKTAPPKPSVWLPQYDFDPVTFAKPPVTFGPYARWWWPGNDVTKDELQREINLFADHGFGGVEVQALALGLLRSSSDASARIMTWDTPAYYDNLKTVLEEARKRGLTVDLTDGSGWPPGGSFLDPTGRLFNPAIGHAEHTGGRVANTSPLSVGYVLTMETLRIIIFVVWYNFTGLASNLF